MVRGDYHVALLLHQAVQPPSVGDDDDRDRDGRPPTAVDNRDDDDGANACLLLRN